MRAGVRCGQARGDASFSSEGSSALAGRSCGLSGSLGARKQPQRRDEPESTWCVCGRRAQAGVAGAGGGRR